MPSSPSSEWTRIARVLTTAVAVIFLTEGCGAAIMMSSWGTSPERISPGSIRADVKDKLGRPVASQPTPDGGRVETYNYRVHRTPEPGWAPTPDNVALTVFGTVLYFGLPELVLTPYAIYQLTTHPRRDVKIAFGPDDRVAWVGSPPAFGPADDSVEPPSIGAIRTRCRSQELHEPSERSASGDKNLTPSEDRYVACVMGGLAIWGIE